MSKTEDRLDDVLATGTARWPRNRRVDRLWGCHCPTCRWVLSVAMRRPKQLSGSRSFQEVDPACRAHRHGAQGAVHQRAALLLPGTDHSVWIPLILQNGITNASIPSPPAPPLVELIAVLAVFTVSLLTSRGRMFKVADDPVSIFATSSSSTSCGCCSASTTRGVRFS